MTRDIDIIVEVGDSDAERLYSLFSKDFYIDIDSIRDAIRILSIMRVL
jgi:hypothetical protein